MTPEHQPGITGAELADCWDRHAAAWRRSIRGWQVLAVANAGLLAAATGLVVYGLAGHPADGWAACSIPGAVLAGWALFYLTRVIPPKLALTHERYGAALRQATMARARGLPSHPDIPDVF